jgi:hypothetical protein
MPATKSKTRGRPDPTWLERQLFDLAEIFQILGGDVRDGRIESWPLRALEHRIVRLMPTVETLSADAGLPLVLDKSPRPVPKKGKRRA